MKQDVTVISKKKIAGNDLLSFNEVKLRLANDKIKTHFDVERVPAVSVIPIKNNNEIYLISQYRYLHNKEVLESVAGKIDKGETPLSCAKRELEEEAGIKAKNWKEYASIDLAGSYINARVSLFLAKDLEFSEQKLQEDENIQVVKLNLDEAVEKVINGEITTSTSIIGILWLDKLKRERKL